MTPFLVLKMSWLKVKLQEKAADVTKDVLVSGTGDSFPGTEEILVG